MGEYKKVEFTDKIKEVATVEEFRLILNQAEIRNMGENHNGESLYNKSVIFLGVSITALTSLIVYLSDKAPSFTPKYFVCCELVVLFIVISCRLKPILKLEQYYGNGATPFTLLHQDFFTDLEVNKSPEWYILQRLIEDYEERIFKNRCINQRRGEAIKDVVEWTYWAIGISIITYALFFLFLGF